MDFRKQQAGRSNFAWHLRTGAAVIYSDVYGKVSGASEHLLGPSVVGRDDVDPERGTRESGAAPAMAHVGHREPWRWRTEADVGVTIRGSVVAEDLEKEFHREARYRGAFVLPLAKPDDQGLSISELLI